MHALILAALLVAVFSCLGFYRETDFVAVEGYVLSALLY
jgi:hypothetical protein